MQNIVSFKDVEGVVHHISAYEVECIQGTSMTVSLEARGENRRCIALKDAEEVGSVVRQMKAYYKVPVTRFEEVLSRVLESVLYHAPMYPPRDPKDTPVSPVFLDENGKVLNAEEIAKRAMDAQADKQGTSSGAD